MALPGAELRALLDRCGGAAPAYAPLAEAFRVRIAGELPSLAGARRDNDAAR